MSYVNFGILCVPCQGNAYCQLYVYPLFLPVSDGKLKNIFLNFHVPRGPQINHFAVCNVKHLLWSVNTLLRTLMQAFQHQNAIKQYIRQGKEFCFSIIKTNLLMLLIEIIISYCKRHTKFLNTLSEQNAGVVNA
jgi:hypothetical protein